MNKLTDKQKKFLYQMKEQNLLYLGMDIHITMFIKLLRVLDEGKYSDEDREWLNELRESWKEYLKNNLV
jgi:hypothetical protein